MPNFNFTERQENQLTIVDLQGKILFGEDSLRFHRLIRNLVDRGEKRILLNFAKVTFIDSSGLGELVGGYVAVRKIGGEIILFNLSPNVMELIVLTKLSTVFDIYENEREAKSCSEVSDTKTVSITSQF